MARDVFAAAAAEEELVAAACAAAARWVPGAEAQLHALAAAHLATATALMKTAAARPRRWRTFYAGLQAMLAAVVGTELGTLLWLRRQEQRLLDVYVALEASPVLTVTERQRLRFERVPAAFDRFGRVDRWIMLREEQGVYA